MSLDNYSFIFGIHIPSPEEYKKLCHNRKKFSLNL